MKTLLITHTFLIFLLLPGMSWAQFIAISGYINDSSTGKALENVSIFDSNSKIGTITNQNGFYRLVLHERNADLTFTFDGFKDCKRHIELSSDTTLQVSMQPAILQQKQQKKSDNLHADNLTLNKQDQKQDQREK
ncbi:MAG TPA: carboxypeptidase-like regulatory domain-containing protein [Draconibacterium sp.]|nr:carboxypeptidase-like regulatory domain-containing protein [Draconibacterium sp.]